MLFIIWTKLPFCEHIIYFLLLEYTMIKSHGKKEEAGLADSSRGTGACHVGKATLSARKCRCGMLRLHLLPQTPSERENWQWAKDIHSQSLSPRMCSLEQGYSSKIPWLPTQCTRCSNTWACGDHVSLNHHSEPHPS